jgi:hypothetical protein
LFNLNASPTAALCLDCQHDLRSATWTTPLRTPPHSNVSPSVFLSFFRSHRNATPFRFPQTTPHPHKLNMSDDEGGGGKYNADSTTYDQDEDINVDMEGNDDYNNSDDDDNDDEPLDGE